MAHCAMPLAAIETSLCAPGAHPLLWKSPTPGWTHPTRPWTTASIFRL